MSFESVPRNFLHSSRSGFVGFLVGVCALGIPKAGEIYKEMQDDETKKQGMIQIRLQILRSGESWLINLHSSASKPFCKNTLLCIFASFGQKVPVLAWKGKSQKAKKQRARGSDRIAGLLLLVRDVAELLPALRANCVTPCAGFKRLGSCGQSHCFKTRPKKKLQKLVDPDTHETNNNHILTNKTPPKKGTISLKRHAMGNFPPRSSRREARMRVPSFFSVVYL